jgi:cyclase
VLLDIGATRSGRGPDLATVRAVRAELPIPLCVGGGVRSLADAEQLLQAGADKVAVNSAAVADPTLLHRLASRFGRQAVVLALDAQRLGGDFVVCTHAGSKPTSWRAAEWARTAVAAGAGEVLLTSIDRDGTGTGYDLDLLATVRQAVDVPLIASGGARTAADLAAALRGGADAVLLASLLHDGHTTVTTLKRDLLPTGLPLRP